MLQGCGCATVPRENGEEVEANTELAYRAFVKGMFHSHCTSCYNLLQSV